MAHLLLFRLHGTRKNILKARTSMSRLRKWIRKGVTNCKPLYELLKAEYAVTRNSRTRVSFDSACHLANEHGFEHIEAFAYERAGVYASSMGNRIEAKALVKKSMELYRKWGASAKTRWLEGQHFALLQEGRPVTLEVLVPVSRGMVEEDKSTEDTIETSNFRDRLGERNYTRWYRTIDG